MAPPSPPPWNLSRAYRRSRSEGDDLPRKQISYDNELRPLFPGTGNTHQLASHDLTLEDAVLTIAAVLLGASEIRYPFKIAMGDLEFYRSLENQKITGQALPQHADAFLAPIDLDVINRARQKGKAKEPTEKAANGDKKRLKPEVYRNFALAICEPSGKNHHGFGIDLASFHGRPTEPGVPVLQRRICEEIPRALRRSQWQGRNELHFRNSIRHEARPAAPDGYEVHAAILHAWAYILDIPLCPSPRIPLASFATELLDLFNLALRGQMTRSLLKTFLWDTEYIHLEGGLVPFPCIPEKYRPQIRNACSVEIRQDTDNEGDHASIVAISSTDDEADSLGDVRNAIGSLWCAILEGDDSGTATAQFGMVGENNRAYAPDNDDHLILLHTCPVDGTPFTYLATATRIPHQIVDIRYYGIGQRGIPLSLIMRMEDAVKNCAWHGGSDVTKIKFGHFIVPTPCPNDSNASPWYAIFFGWCLLLGLDIEHSVQLGTDDAQKEAMDVIDRALTGKVSFSRIKAFLRSHGFTRKFTSRSGDANRLTSDQAASSNALNQFIRDKRAIKSPSPPHPDSPASLKESEAARAGNDNKSKPSPEESKAIARGKQDSKTTVKEKPSTTSNVASTQALSTEQPVLKLRASPTATSAWPTSKDGSRKRKRSEEGHEGRKAPRKEKYAAASKDVAPQVTTKETQSPKKRPPPISTDASAVLASAGVETRSRSSRNSISPSVPSSKSSSSKSGASKITERRTKIARPPPPKVRPRGTRMAIRKIIVSKESDSENNWMKEFRSQLQRCKDNLGEMIKKKNTNIRKKMFDKANGGTAPEDGTVQTVAGDLILSLWMPMWKQGVKYGLVDISQVRLLEDPNLSKNAMTIACGGPYPLLMPMWGSGETPSPEPSMVPYSGIGHIWLGVATINERDLLDDDDNPTLREVTQEHEIHVDIQIYDTAPGFLPARTKYGKPEGLVRHSGWAAGRHFGEPVNENQQRHIYPFDWQPTINKPIDMPCPNQTKGAVKRANACGLLTVLHAWMVLLDLEIPARRSSKPSAEDFYNNLIQLFDLALAGALTTRTIQAFVNAYGYIARVQPLHDYVIQATTEHPDLSRMFMRQLAEEAAYDRYILNPTEPPPV